MYLDQETEKVDYLRSSKLGIVHSYTRVRTRLIFRCDNCGQIFSRYKCNISPKRITNNYFHCCNNCDFKKFAQRKGVERRMIWDVPASSELKISRL
jgi:hypothetical protein